LGDALDDGQAEADACVVGVYALGAAPERLGECGDQLWVSFSPVFSTVSFTLVGWALVVTRTVPCSGRLRTIALCTRFVVICSSSAGEPMVGVMSPEVSMVMPRCCASGRSVSVASSATRDGRRVLGCTTLPSLAA
jgi:hypothetical protein